MEHDQQQECRLTELQDELEAAQQFGRQVQGEKDEEKRSRVSFEMRLVEFEEYKKHAEADIVCGFKHVNEITFGFLSSILNLQLFCQKFCKLIFWCFMHVCVETNHVCLRRCLLGYYHKNASTNTAG